MGRYLVYGPIASGGMATVHFGALMGEAGFSRTVAIKRLRGDKRSRPMVSGLIDEARLVSRISHPNVVPTLDVVWNEGELLVVLEY
ncbi:MAG TPA: protein kinase, partial [Polyangiaceae bacterium]|nr:protein kinase [Polyangiaceae bacterium]